MRTQFSWTVPPDQIADGVARWRDAVRKAVLELFQVFRARVVTYAMEHAPWTDRTSNARQGLFAEAFDEGALLTLILAHSMYYGIYLETKGWATIMPTIEAMYPALMAAVSGLLA